MSVKIMSQIWEESKQEGSTLLMLLAIADHANDQGICWPSKRTLAKKCRITERHSGRLIKKLVEAGEIEIQRGGGRGRSNVYKVTPRSGFSESDTPNYRGTPMSPFIKSENETLTSLSVNPDPQRETLTPGDVKGDIAESLESLEPSLEPSKESSNSRSNNKRNEMIEVILEVCNLSWDTFRQNGKMRGLVNRTAKIILKRELTLDNIRQFYGKGGWWWTDHWIGKDKNSAPRPEQIADTLDQAIDSDQNSEVHRQEFAEGWENR